VGNKENKYREKIGKKEESTRISTQTRVNPRRASKWGKTVGKQRRLGDNRGSEKKTIRNRR
jgi:hypothetical protein